MVARRYMVTGHVQGVGYRNYVEHTAGKLNVDGYVRNRRDGSVETAATAAWKFSRWAQPKNCRNCVRRWSVGR